MMSDSHARINPQPHDALLIVDLQNDFLPGGSMAVPTGDEILPLVNRYVILMQTRGLPVFASKDWHPQNHCSFTAQGGQWPEHCVANTQGAAFPRALKLAADTPVILKGQDAAREAYSAFQGTELEHLLRQKGVDRLLVCGLTTDYCVLSTVRDALDAGFRVCVLTDAVRAVDLHPGDGARAIEEMAGLGAEFSELTEPVS
jgi:nicotinamidase/pyrazinamidase